MPMRFVGCENAPECACVRKYAFKRSSGYLKASTEKSVPGMSFQVGIWDGICVLSLVSYDRLLPLSIESLQMAIDYPCSTSTPLYAVQRASWSTSTTHHLCG